jgi:hypothetical protein
MAVEAFDKQRSLRKSHPNHHNHFAAQDRFRFSGVTSALSCSTSPAAVRPNPLTTAPVPFRKKARSSRTAIVWPHGPQASVRGSAAGRFSPAPIRDMSISAFASLSPLADRRPKPKQESNL